jgi:micrococcal nuclease
MFHTIKQLRKHTRCVPVTAALLLAFFSTQTVGADTPRQQAIVVHVIDGDTVKVRVGSRHEHLRLIGIDTPESRPNRRSEMQSSRAHQDQKSILKLGQRATERTRQLLPKGKPVQLEYDTDQRDHYGRLLAYVWLSDGTMANEEILRSGYGYLLTVPPNVRYRERLAAAFSDARKQKRGLWTDLTTNDPSVAKPGGRTAQAPTRRPSHIH